ncbi:MAG: flagellar biosynthesis protein FlhB [Gammaproteobacteria bacterium]|nr:flagellar biosynthesis protein FlhB [Gammaproteobacteria bacterium]
MAESDTSSDQRTEQPTEKRLRDARERGQIPRSRELSIALVMLAGAGSLIAMRPFYGERLGDVLLGGLRLDVARLRDDEYLLQTFVDAIGGGLALLAPLLVVVVVAAVTGALAFGGWMFSLQPLAPKLDKLNPITGLKRVFGWNGLLELGKALAKFLLVAAFAIVLLWVLADDFVGLGRLPVDIALSRAGYLVGLSFLGLSATLLIIAGIDVPAQWWQFQRRMRMTRQEIKEEFKETEGRPEVRSRIRAAQQELATRRMMEDVGKADVVATNPTHYAVALRYDASRMRAPRVVAKGADLVALSIRNVAKAHGVPLFEHPLLTRALYYTTAIGMEIPPRLYMAVAQVLTYVYQLRDGGATGPQAPRRPDIEIEPDVFTDPSVARAEADA